MPIRINLLAEDLELEEMRRKDPVKRALWISGFVVFLVVLWGLTLFLKIVVAKAETASLESKWAGMESLARQVDENRRKTAEVERRLSALTQFATNRFLWGSALDALQRCGVDNTHLVRLKAEQAYSTPEPAKAAVLPPGVPPSAAPAPAATAGSPSKAPVAREKISVLLDGRDYSPRVGEQVSKFKEALAASPFFQAHLDKTNSIQLTSLSAPQDDSSRKAAFVQFGLQLNLQEKERRLYE